MTARKLKPWRPDWIEPPGPTIREKLRELGMTQEQAAEKMGVTGPYLSGIINGHRAITPRAALHLEAATGVSAEFWAGLWAHYAIAIERKRAA